MSSKPKTKLVLTGGGTAGHVMLHLALLPQYKAANLQLLYIGGKGVEESLASAAGIPFQRIRTGKLRRYFSLQNFLDIFNIFFGFLQSLRFLYAFKPDLVFSKGGFVSVPVGLAAYLLRIPLVTHESDYTPGLATKILLPCCTRVFYAFKETAQFLPASKAQWVPTPVRDFLRHGDVSLGIKFCAFRLDDVRPVILVMGGSQGALALNQALEKVLPRLLLQYRVILLSGKGKGIRAPELADGFCSFEYVDQELPHLFALASVVVSRAGANAIFEFLALKKPMLLVPLVQGSRGDQVHNARSFVESGFAKLLLEKDCQGPQGGELLYQAIASLIAEKEQYISRMTAVEIGRAHV